MALNKSFGVGSDIAAGAYADALREWVPVQGSNSNVMLLSNGFAVRAPGKMYAKVEVPSQLISDLGFIPGYNIDEGGVGIEYFSWESKIAFKTQKGTFILDGKKNPELYGELKDFLLEDNVLLGTAGGLPVDMGKEESSKHSTLYKAGVVTLTILTAVGLSGCTGTSADTAKEKVQINSYAGEVTATPAPSNTQVAAADSNIPAWLNLGKDWRDRVVGKLNLPAEGAGLKRTAGGDDKYDDNELVVGDGVPELAAGIQGDNIALVVDREFFEKYPTMIKRLHNENNGNPTNLLKEDFIEVAPGMGLYYLIVPIDGNGQMTVYGKEPDSFEEAKSIPIIKFEK